MSEFSAYGLGGSQNPVYYDDFDNTGLLSLVEDINKSKLEDDADDFLTGAMAEIKQSDIDLMKTRGGKLLDYDTFKTISGNDSLTPAEHAQLKATV